MFLLLSLDGLEILSELLILRAKFDSLFDIVESIVKVLKLSVSDTSQEESFYRIFVDLNNFGAFVNCLAEVADAVEADRSILQAADS